MKKLIAIVLAVTLLAMGAGVAVANPVPPSQKVLYGVNSADDSLSVIDPVSGAVSVIGPLDPDVNVYTTPVRWLCTPLMASYLSGTTVVQRHSS